MRDNIGASSGEDGSGVGIRPETTCGYCTQGKDNECQGYGCACAENGHPTV
jgi:hypothetical protein